jgi:hypothetical protein
MTAAGIRRNNPGNLEKGTSWKGLADIQPDKRFCTFVTPEYGIRALTKVLLTYNKKYRIKTIEGIINRYAPPIENPTKQYIKNVALWSGVKEREAIDFTNPKQLASVVAGIIRQENGVQPYPEAVILDGVEMALE